MLSSVTCSRKYDGDRLFHATYGRTCCSSLSYIDKNYDKGANRLCTQMASISIEFKERAVRARADVGESDESVSWCAYDTIARIHDGRTGLAISGRGKPPRASKYDLKRWFIALVSAIVKGDNNTSNIAKVSQDDSLLGDHGCGASLLEKRLLEHPFARNVGETMALPYAKFKAIVTNSDRKSLSLTSLLARGDVNLTWRDGARAEKS